MVQVRPVLDIPIFHKVYDLYKLLHRFHETTPKSERYTLWQKCENTTLALLEAVIETSYLQDEERLRTLHSISNKLELLKVLFRLASDTRTIDKKQYVEIQSIIREIGKMIGGWIKFAPH